MRVCCTVKKSIIERVKLLFSSTNRKDLFTHGLWKPVIQSGDSWDVGI